MNVQVDERALLRSTLPPHATDRKEKESTLRLFRAPPARPVFSDDKACLVAWCDRSIPVTQASGHTLAQPVEGPDTGRQGRQAGKAGRQAHLLLTQPIVPPRTGQS